MANKPALGIDIGGTNVKLGLVSSTGEVLDFEDIPTPKSTPQASVGIIAGEAAEFASSESHSIEELAGIGIGFPGALDMGSGTVRSAPNMEGWNRVPAGELFEQFLGRPVLLDNDANLAALAEYRWGAGEGADPLILYTLGTGVGGGIVIGGEIFRGSWGGAAELGHQVIDMNGRPCSCGNRGCIEAIAGNRGIASRSWELLKKDKASLLWDMMNGQFDSLDAEMVGNAAKEGDPSAKKVAAEVTRALGVAVANTINVFNPECVLLAGGMTEWGEELLLRPLIKSARRNSFKTHFESCRIGFASAGYRAGVLGAAALVFSGIRGESG